MARISLSDVRFTEREIRAIRDAAAAIASESRKEAPRPVRIINLSERISLAVRNAERRKVK